MNICICGICGKMGNSIYKILKDDVNYNIIGIDFKKDVKDVLIYDNYLECFEKEKIDVVVDFTNNHFADEVITYALKNKIKVISGTTGIEKENFNKYVDLSKSNKTSFIWSSNYAIGIKLFSKELRRLKRNFYKYDLIESHYKEKKDKPSGTSKELANILKIPEKDIQVLRVNNQNATHELIFQSDYEKITIKHEVLDRKAFIYGLLEELQVLIKESYVLKIGFTK